jgi:hypothetical protein
MNSRDLEDSQLERCVAAARGATGVARDQQDANVFLVAAKVLQSRYVAESGQLRVASERYFDRHPAERLTSAEVVRNHWVVSLPRLRDMLSQKLERNR